MTRALVTSSSAVSHLLLQPACTLYILPRPLSRRYESTFHHEVKRSYASAPPIKFSTKRQSTLKPQTESSPSEPTPPTVAPPASDTSAIETYGDGMNPPLSTLPPPLTFPERKPDTSTPVYWYHIGRSYGKFYIAGVKATYANYKKAKGLRKAIRASNADPVNNITGADDEGAAYPPRRMLGLLPPPLLLDIEVFMRREGLTRSQLQLLVREREDVKKLPLFAVLVALFGEWLPLIVPFIPGRVPRTCRIPKQVAGMRKAIEERRKETFRQGLAGPDQQKDGVLEMIKMRVTKSREFEEALEKASKRPAKGRENDLGDTLGAREGADVMALRVQPANWLAVEMTEALTREQLTHVSTNLGLHGKIWDRLGLVGNSSFTALLLKLRVVKRLNYLNLDDELLLKNRTHSWHKMSKDELEIACDERGIDVTGRKEEDLKRDLGKWFEGRVKDKGYGSEIMKMLFRR